MVRKKSKKTVLPLLVIISAIIFTGLIGAITFSNIFPTTTPYVTSDSTVNLSYGIHAGDGLSSITHSWNGTNTTLYDENLVLFMNFDNRSALGENDTLVRDLSMYENNGTVVGGENITWTANGKYGGAFNWSLGRKAYIESSNSTSIQYLGNTTNISFSVWVKFNNLDTAYVILSKDNVAYQDRIKLTSTGTIIEAVFERLNMGTVSAKKSGELSANTWINFIVVFDGTNISLYKNAILLNSTATGGYMKSGSLAPIWIGKDTDGYYFNGSIDDVMIWNRTLSTNEINTLYNSQITKYNSTYFENNLTKTTSIFAQPSFLCSKNATAVEFCSSTTTIRTNNIIKSNFSTSKGTINNYFYAVGSDWAGSSYGRIYLQNGTNYASDYNWNNLQMKNANLYYHRLIVNFSALSQSEGVFKNTTNSNEANIELYKDLVVKAKENDFKLLLMVSWTPDWLANKTDGYCNLTTQQNYTCRPYNYTKWGDMIAQFLQYTQCNPDICEIEVWSEPNLVPNLLNNVSWANPIRADVYNKIYNATWISVKALNSSYQIGGPTTTLDLADSENIMDLFLGNFSNQTDFVSHHAYLGPYSGLNFSYIITKELSWIYNKTSFYNGNVTRVIISEFNNGNSTIQVNQTDLFANTISEAYITTLNLYPSNITISQHQWSLFYYYNSGTRYSMVSEPLLNNEYYISYNVTKNFAHLCPSGATVSVTSNDDASIKQVSCKKGNMYSLIVINTDTNAKNVTANLSLTNGSVFYPYTSIMNYETGASIPVSSQGIIQLGVLDSYEVLYLTSGDEDGGTLVNLFKLNEATGTKVYDLLQNVTYGTISGATWINDSIFKTLTSAIDYTISTSGLLVVSSSYLFNYMNVSWSYLATWRDTGSTASLVMVDSLGNSTTFLSILIVISFAVVILTLFKPSVNTNPLGKPHY